MNILDQIIAHKKTEVEDRKRITSVKSLEKSIYFSKPNISLKKSLLDPSKTGIIAEFKKRSPSKGIINANVTVEEVVKGYEDAGASAVSVLTDIQFFGGSDEDLLHARDVINIPILRKEFIIDEYQIVEAKAMGANIILLIAAVLSPERIQQLASFTKSLGMEILLEVHDEEELLRSCCDEIDAVGINNRNLKTFQVDIQTSIKLAELIPDRFLKVSESGIESPEVILKLKEHGFRGFLIGEYFMKAASPADRIKAFVNDIHKLEKEHKKINPA